MVHVVERRWLQENIQVFADLRRKATDAPNLKWTHIEDKEEPASVDEDDGAGDHGHQPGGGHADDPGEVGRQGAVAQTGTKTPRLQRKAP